MGKKQGMDYMDNILREVIAGFSPDKARIIKETGKVLKKINSGLSKSRIRAKAVAGGSVAKGTFLKGDHDCDIFVKFSLKEYRNQDISLLLEKVLRKAFKSLDKVHGSRDYYHMKNEFKYEIVPVLDIRKSSQAVNVTDCSPLHVKWVNKFPKMKKEIMLTKAFCKSAGVYGAESYIQGFSGHVVDIITVYYGGFLNLLKESKRWKKKEIIDYYKYHKGRAMFNLNRSKTQSPLIVIDPVQPDRNAAAALGEEKFELFRKK
ncbi:MAG: nucleotidyltransferase domain-containing protein, partial [Nanoarchaeota archaeon]|nr:nucleotidyltransferase domain-containing protein [Nanoarchaeota archaeon]